MRLKKLRKQRNLTQEVLAELSGVDQVTISYIEIGKVRNPHWVTVSGLGRALGVSTEELFKPGAGEPFADAEEESKSA